jgi:hypothetical protein
MGFVGRGFGHPPKADVTGRLWELAALVVALMVAGAILAAPVFVLDQRLAAMAALVGGFLVLARLGRRPR